MKKSLVKANVLVMSLLFTTAAVAQVSNQSQNSAQEAFKAKLSQQQLQMSGDQSAALSATMQSNLQKNAKNFSSQNIQQLQAMGGINGGGGNKAGLEFQAAASRGLQNLFTMNVLGSNDRQKVIAALQPAKFYVDNKPITVKTQIRAGAQTNNTAENFPDQHYVHINQTEMDSVKSDELTFQAIAAHEVLSLAHLEATGDYHLSANILNMVTGSNGLVDTKMTMQKQSVSQMSSQELSDYQQKLFAEMRSQQAGRSPYEVLKELFDTAPKGATMSDIGVFDANASAKNYYQIMRNDAQEGDTLEEITDANDSKANGATYLTALPTTVIITPAQSGTDATPGEGPLFPGKPATSGKDAVISQPFLVIQATPAVLFGESSLSRDTTAWNQGSFSTITPTATDLIDKVLFLGSFHQAGGASYTVYVRKSGDLLVIKYVMYTLDDAGKKKITISYNYGWKDSSK